MLRTAGIGNFPASRIPWQRKYGDKAAGVVLGSLSDVIASAVFDLDVTQAASYSGSGTTWSNLVAAPADGSAQTAYDFYTGDGSTSATYPTFNGSAGNSAAYWSFDGGDYFDLKSGANTAFLRNAHKTTGGSDFWIAMAYRPVDGGVTQGLFTTMDGTAVAGFRTEQLGSELIQLVQRGPTTTQTNGGYVTPGADTLYIASHSHATNKTTHWRNSLTGSSVSHTFSTTTTDATRAARIGQRTTGNSPLLSGNRLYAVAMGNEYLDNAKAAAIIAALEARHNRDYTP